MTPRRGVLAPALLVLEDGRIFRGEAFGAEGETFGEVVFTTGMTGYQETLTDPSYHRQIVVMTAPHIGNTGVNDEDPESSRIWVAGYAVRDPSPRASSWRARRTLGEELAAHGVVGISGIDTRALTRHIREHGAMRAGVSTVETNPYALRERVLASPLMTGADLAREVSTPQPYIVPADATAGDATEGDATEGDATEGDATEEGITAEGATAEGATAGESADRKTGPAESAPGAEAAARFRVVAVDLGIKAMTPRLMAERGIEVHVLPAASTAQEILALDPDGVFLSNGPGDPATADYAVQAARGVLDAGVPLFGICFGHQVLGRALGFGTYKLKYGHRGINQPVRDRATGRVEVTVHNHGFAVDAPVDAVAATPYGRVEVSHVCLNDGVVEGLRCQDVPAFGVQYHPEAAAGPHDAGHLFDQFAALMSSTTTNDRGSEGGAG